MMDGVSTGKKTRQELIQSLMEHGNKAFNPDSGPKTRAEGQQALNDLVQSTGTLSLMLALNTLIRPDHVPPWLQSELKAILTTLPLRPDGVRTTMEFVFAVHPSGTVKTSEAATPQKRGANITHESLSIASNLLSTPPKRITAQTWFAATSPQLFKLLDGHDGPELAKVASYVVGFGILGRKDFGAPGAPGWKFLVEPMLCQLDPSLSKHTENKDQSENSDAIVDLSQDRVLVSSDDLALALRRLKTLVVSHPNPSLCKRLLGPVLLPLWTMSSWPDVNEAIQSAFSRPAMDLLKIYVKLGVSQELFYFIIRHLTYTGPQEGTRLAWSYRTGADGRFEIVKQRQLGARSRAGDLINLDEIDHKLALLLELLETSASDLDISSVFVGLFKRWVDLGTGTEPGRILVKDEENEQQDNAVSKIAEIKLMQNMMEKLPGKVVSRSDHALEMVSQILDDSQATTGGEESIPVALSVLNLVITAPSFRKDKVEPGVLQLLQSSLEKLARTTDSDVASTARNLGLLLRYRDEVEDLESTPSGPTRRQLEDRRTYNLAMSYISQMDSPPPVRMQGLDLMSTLIQAHSPVLDIPAILVLMSTLLSDEEDYVNLQVIKIFTQLADKHPKSAIQELLDHYVDAKEKGSVDTRLRFGEALTQAIERLGETFTGDIAQKVANALLSTAGRRGYRPKTEAKQAKDERMRKMKHKEAEEAWGGEVPDMSDDIPEEERARNEIMARIIEGWESKRGTEDVRIRTSALSIFANGMETNIGGIGSSMISTAVDLCVNILTMEPELEKGILRRAAILLILDFVRALDKAKQEGRRLGFGLTTQSRGDIMRILEYVGQVDNDGLVKQHAKDVIESLQNWELSSFVPEDGRDPGGAPTLTKLAGLSVNPEQPDTDAKPRIEEIE